MVCEERAALGEDATDQAHHPGVMAEALLARGLVPQEARVSGRVVGEPELHERPGVVAVAVQDLPRFVVAFGVACEGVGEGRDGGRGRRRGRGGRVTGVRRGLLRVREGRVSEQSRGQRERRKAEWALHCRVMVRGFLVGAGATGCGGAGAGPGAGVAATVAACAEVALAVARFGAVAGRAGVLAAGAGEDAAAVAGTGSGTSDSCGAGVSAAGLDVIAGSGGIGEATAVVAGVRQRTPCEDIDLLPKGEEPGTEHDDAGNRHHQYDGHPRLASREAVRDLRAVESPRDGRVGQRRPFGPRARRDGGHACGQPRSFDDPADAVGPRTCARRPELDQRRCQLAHVAKAPATVLVEATQDRRLEGGRHVGARAAERCRRLGGDLHREIRHRLAAEGRVPRQKLVKNHAERPDVCTRVGLLRRAHLLGRHVER